MASWTGRLFCLTSGTAGVATERRHGLYGAASGNTHAIKAEDRREVGSAVHGGQWSRPRGWRRPGAPAVDVQLAGMPVIDGDFVARGLIWYLVFVFSTVLHEASHSLVAQLGGDETAAQGGQVGLDPLPHIQREPIGMVVIPLITYFLNGFMMGWASAPYDPFWAEQYPRRAARMALAGPAANFLLALLTGIAIRVGLAQGAFQLPTEFSLTQVVVAHGGQPTFPSMALSAAFVLNLLLGCFNLLPFPPLDGSGAVGLLMPENVARRWQGMMRTTQFTLLGLLLAIVIFDKMSFYVLVFGLRLLLH